MEKRFLFVVVFILLVGFGFASDGWDDLDDYSDDVSVVSEEEDEVEDEGIFEEVVESFDSVETDSRYTSNFYLALLLIGVVLIIMIIVVWLFFRGSKNKWE